MSVNQNFISNLSKDKYTIKAESTQTLSFLGATPNYYRITNGGATPLYLGVSMMPTEDFFDMKIPSGTTKLYVDAYGHDEIYVFNPSVSDANIIVTSFTAPFDSTVLAMSDIGQDFTNIELSGAFDATGDLKTILNSIKSYVANLKSNAEYDICTKWYKGTNTDAENIYTMKYIEFLSNDSDTDLFVSISSTGNITLKPGEVLNKIKLDETRTITIPKNSTYRLVGC